VELHFLVKRTKHLDTGKIARAVNLVEIKARACDGRYA
jgi:hypothetical protein